MPTRTSAFPGGGSRRKSRSRSRKRIRRKSKSRRMGDRRGFVE